VLSGYQVYVPVLGTLTAIVPTVSKSEGSPCRRVRVTVGDESVVHVITNGWPGVRLVEAVIEVKAFSAYANATRLQTQIIRVSNNIFLDKQTSDFGELKQAQGSGGFKSVQATKKGGCRGT
jgi:hypothetical protein